MEKTIILILVFIFAIAYADLNYLPFGNKLDILATKNKNLTKNYDILKDTTRICITDSVCNCKTIATQYCNLNKNSTTFCYEQQLKTCNKKCEESRRCYGLSCKNAGARHCRKIAKKHCEKFADSSDYDDCIKRKTKCCKRSEMGTCKKARRIYSYRQTCEVESHKKCSQFKGKTQCQCLSQSRKECVEHKIKIYTQKIRTYFNCRESSRMLCSHKSCGFEYRSCLKKERALCEPVCERKSRELCNEQTNGPCYDEEKRKCIDKWSKNYCKERANLKCFNDNNCITRELEKCKEDLPKCMKNSTICDDKNECTIDICHPRKGCIRKPRNCDDNDRCTSEHCDKVLGCVYKRKTCNDNKLCSTDTCDPTSGKCIFTFNKRNSCKCNTGPCQTNEDCKEWGRYEKLELSCQKAICDNDVGACVAVQKKKKCAEKCKRTCFPYDACDIAKCVLNEVGDYDCVHSQRICDDHKKCTKDSCDPRVGCIFKAKESKKCPPHPLCDSTSDCIQWGIDKKLSEKCQKSYCDIDLGICKATVSNLNCTLEKCLKHCKPNHQCETTKCITEENGTFCKKTPIICDDKKSCTTDTCDPIEGCKFKYEVSELCPRGQECNCHHDCISWGISQNLKDQCKKPVCDLKLGACKAVPLNIKCKTDLEKCQEDCFPEHKCDRSFCALDDSNTLSCMHFRKSCDDNKQCTKDSCDKELGCTHTYEVSEDCPKNAQCDVDSDCMKWSFENNLSKTCMKAVCDVSKGACKAVKKNKLCVSKEDCEASCKAQNRCDTAKCQLDFITGNYVCNLVQKSCDDGKSCTLDYCDRETEKCTHKFTSSVEGCSSPCNTTRDCKEWGITENLKENCRRPKCDMETGSCKSVPIKSNRCSEMKSCKKSCIPRTLCETAKCEYDEKLGSAKCVYSPLVCDDKKKCTDDTCAIDVGCVYTYQISKNCPFGGQCSSDLDCHKWAKENKLEDKCEVAQCNLEYGKCVSVPSLDRTCVNKKECESKCKPKNACESVKCVKKEDKSVTCEVQINTCNDNKVCTKDTCDPKTGKCSNTYTVNETCTINGYCEKNLDCVQWGINLDRCQTAVCDNLLGTCKAVPNQKTCTKKTCNKLCPPRNKCEKSACRYDVNNQIVCEFKERNCDDKIKCTADSCEPTIGCVRVFDKTIEGCNTPKCKEKSDCMTWARDNELLDKCKDAICDESTSTCKAVLVNNEKCNPYLNLCKKECVPKDACESAICVVDALTNKYECQRRSLKCNDNNNCTLNVCDPQRGCTFPYVVSEECPKYCKKDEECSSWGLSKNLTLSCKVAVCDISTTSCKIKDDPNKDCKDIEKVCKSKCKPKDSCHLSECVRNYNNKNQYECIQTKKVCDDKKTCTHDSCNEDKGCVFDFKYSNTCLKPCDKDLDCQSWAESNKLKEKCELGVCDLESGSCKAIRGPQTDTCKGSNNCDSSKDCPQSKFGTLCCVENGLKKCCDNECKVDTDCKAIDFNGWGYCKTKESGKKVCEFKDKCTRNLDCNDNNPCTKDVCVLDYGFCKNIPRCTDNSECTTDICLPSNNKKGYTCKNPSKVCTDDKTLLDKNFDLLSPGKKNSWLGQCSHIDGCVTCVVNSQCDDNNGCTADSCENKLCVHKPLDNEWCDPKLKGSKLNYISISDLKNKKKN